MSYASRTGLPFEVKIDGSTSGGIEGYASTFGGFPDSYGDVIAPGAFKASLAEHAKVGTQPIMLWSHRQEQPVGRWDSVLEDSHGLLAVGRLNLNTQAGREAYAHVKHNDIAGLSIGYSTLKDGRTSNRDGSATLTRVNLHEISLVAVPANPAARIHQVKRQPVELQSKRELEDLLVNAGLSQRAARKIVSNGWSGLMSEDDEPSKAALNSLLRKMSTSVDELKSMKG